MIKRIKGSLFAKVFILTVAVLLCVSFLVYGVLAWYMPQTYSNNLNAALDEQTSDFIYELEHIRMQDSGGLFVIDLDIDKEKGKHGNETLRDWEAEQGQLPDT